jgi:hypothetical protein
MADEIQGYTDEDKIKEAFETIQKHNAEKIEQCRIEINEFMAHMQEKYNVVIFIPQPEVPKLTILPK